MHHTINDFASQYTTGAQLVHTLVAGAASDDADKETAVADLKGYRSGEVLIPWAATCADGKILEMTVTRLQSADGTNFDAAETIKAKATLFTAAAPAALSGSGIVKLSQNFEGLKRYVKYVVKANLDAANTDVATYSCLLIMGGAVNKPAA
jgi:hypothetical protein